MTTIGLRNSALCNRADCATLCGLDTAKSIAVLKQFEHRQIVGALSKRAQVNQLLIALPHI